MLPDNGGLLVSSWNDSSIYRIDATSGEYLGVFTSFGFLDHPNNLALLTVPEPFISASVLLLLMCIRRTNKAQA
jgi:hypothetical protein